MGLQIRLRHALGERVVDVRARTIDLPLVIGRSKESDLQIPSVTVAARHCVLFVRDGQWVVQDLAGATSLNNEALSGPAALHVGDVLSIGAGDAPATIEIDPAGVEAGRTGAAATEMVATPVPVASPVYAPQPLRVPKAVGISAIRQSRPIGRMMPAAPPPPPPTSAAAVEDEDSVDWGLPAEPGPQRFYVPRRKQSAGPMIAVAVIAAAVIIGGTYAIISYLRPPPPPPPTVAKVAQEPAKHLKSMFDVPGGESSPAKASSGPRAQRTSPPADSSDDNSGSSSSNPPSADTPAAASATPSAASDSDADSHAGDVDWEDVEGAAIAGEPTTAILKIDDYSQKHPGKSTAELKKFENDCLDRLWWQRVIQLCNKRARLHKQIAKDAQDLRESRDAAFKVETTNEQKGFEVELQRADNVLRTEMGYSDDAAPDISDKTQMAKLHAARNPDLFAPWAKKTAKYIRQTHGQTPWGGDE